MPGAWFEACNLWKKRTTVWIWYFQSINVTIIMYPDSCTTVFSNTYIERPRFFQGSFFFFWRTVCVCVWTAHLLSGGHRFRGRGRGTVAPSQSVTRLGICTARWIQPSPFAHRFSSSFFFLCSRTMMCFPRWRLPHSRGGKHTHTARCEPAIFTPYSRLRSCLLHHVTTGLLY